MTLNLLARTANVVAMSEKPDPIGVRLLPWRLPTWVFDGLLISVAVIGFALEPFPESGGYEAVDWITLVAGVAFLLTRRRFPVPTLVAAVATALLVVAIIDRPSILLPVSLVALFTVGLQCGRRVALIAGAVTMVLFAGVVIALLQQGDLDGDGLAAIAWPAFAITAGIGVRASRQNLAATEERARQAEASRELESERRVIEERLRIARDVHDLVAHHIAVISVQSGVAGHLVESDPVAAVQALGVVRSAASTVVDELGDLLGVLRSPDDVGDPTAPTPNLAAIEDLISSFAASGLYVRRETSGIRRDFSDSAQLAAYRVVQEALTNAHKYGDGQADVAVRFDDRGVEIAVSNSIDHSVPQGNGFGLVGMRERVEATGGMLTAAPSADGSRFDLIALLPGRTTA